MGEIYFVTLPNSNLTINLASITLVNWDYAPKEWARVGYISTVQIANRNCVYLDGEDAFILQTAIHEYNLRMGHETSRRQTEQHPNTINRDGWGQVIRTKPGA